MRIFISLCTQLGQWMDSHMQRQADTFCMALAYENGQKFPVFMLGTGSGDWIIVKNQDLKIGTNEVHL
jgi:hypothetical protein